MNYFRSSIPVLALFFLLTGLSQASAGIEYTMEENSGSGEPSTVKVQAEGKRVKMNYERDGEQSEFVIFDGSNETLIVGNPAEKSYLVLDQKTLDGIREMISEAQRRMEQALAQVPEAQREQMRQMMETRMPGMATATGEKPELEVKPTGQSKEIGDYDTNSYEVLLGGRKQAELWVTGWDEIEGSDEVRESVSNMAKFFSNFFESMPQAGQATEDASATWIRAMESVDGFPVRSIAFDADGSQISDTTLTSIRKATFAPSDFDVPEDYTRESLDLP